MAPDREYSIRSSSSPVPTGPGLPLSILRHDDATSCERCRRRKKKCDRQKPSCESCTKSQNACVYLVSSQSTLADSTIRKRTEIARLKARCEELEARIDQMTLVRSSASNHHAHPSSQPISPLPGTPLDAHVERVSLPRQAQLSLVERAVMRILTKEHDAGSSIRGTIGRQLGTTTDDSSHPSNEASTTPLFPHRDYVTMLVDRYFDFSYGVAQYFSRKVIDQESVEALYSSGVAVPDVTDMSAPNIHVYRLSLIFIITAGRLDDHELNMFSPNSAALHALAIKHLPAAFHVDDLTCLTCMCVLGVAAILVFVTMSPYEVTSFTASMALEMGLDKENPELSLYEQEERRRLFWSLFLLDRVVSTYMNRPVSIPEEGISIRLPYADLGGLTTPPDDLSPALFFRHLVLMRRLNGIMFEKITLAAQIPDPDALFTDLRNQIDDWWTNVQASFSTIVAPSTYHSSRHPFFELNYNLFLTNLYRPSRLFAQTAPMRIPILRSASSRAIEMYRELNDRRRLPQNYVQLNNIVVIAVSLLYAIGENEGDPRNLDIGSWRVKALEDLNKCEKLLAGFCVGWPGVERFRQAFGELAMSVKGRLIRSSQPTSLPAWSFPAPTLPAQPALTPVSMGMGDQGALGSTDWTEVTDFGTIDVEAFLSSVGLSDWTSGA